MTNKIVGLDGAPVAPEAKPTPTFNWQITKKNGEIIEAEGYFTVLGGMYPAILRGDEEVNVVVLVNPDELSSLKNLSV